MINTNLIRAQLHAGEVEGGMEMVQVAFSLLFAVTLGALVAALVNGTLTDGIKSANSNIAGTFNDLIANSYDANDSMKTVIS